MANIIQVSDLAGYLKVTGFTGEDATKAADVVNGVNAWVDRYTKRVWGETVNVVGEIQDYSSTVWLDNIDVTAVTKLQIGTTITGRSVVPSSAFIFNSQGRVIINWNENPQVGRETYDMVEVDYSYGNPQVPDDLKLAALALAADYYQATGSNSGNVSMAMIGNYRMQYKDAEPYTHVFDAYRLRRA